MTKVWLGIGSNQGDRLRTLQSAIELLEQKGLQKMAVSQVVETAALGFEGRNFLNAVIYGEWDGDPYELLTVIGETEQNLGRIRSDSERYTDRTIDIDLLLFGEEIIHTKILQVPHPRMLSRNFVLAPFSVFMPDTIHPEAKITIREAMEKCVDKSEVLVYEDKLFVRPQI